VAIDVNSGRATREHNIEDTALRTNLEASDEIARQLRLRDLAGLIVVDFIDMEENRNNRSVERRLKEALKNDRARIQVGRISHFGLLEMSRQRIRTGVLEGSTIICPHCAGAGMVRSTSSIALHVLRVTEDTLIKSASHNITVKTRAVVALYILNQKRENLHELETRFGVTVTIAPDESLSGTTYYAIERGELAAGTLEIAPRPDFVRTDTVRPVDIPTFDDEDAELDAEAGDEAGIEDAGGEGETGDANGDQARRRRRRRRRGRSNGDRETSGIAANAPQPSDDGLAVIAGERSEYPSLSNAAEDEADEDEKPESEALPSGETRRRRSRRRGRGGREPGSNGERVRISEGAVRAQPAEEGGFDEPELELGAEEPFSGEPIRTQTVVPAGAEPEPVAEMQQRPVSAPPSPPQAPIVNDDPDRPKRTGWWQRAKASLGG
jgi:ribonuclease E